MRTFHHNRELSSRKKTAALLLLAVTAALLLSVSCGPEEPENGANAAIIEEIIKSEGSFHQPGVGYNEASGLTYDGIAIDPETGELMGPPRGWSAASKEALHIQLLSMAVAGNEKARLFISPDEPEAAEQLALEILEKKITSFENFNERYPGFAGFLPWFLTGDDGLEPAGDWQDRMPGLDNGQLAWALFQADYILSKTGHRALAQRYRDHWELMAENAVAVFYEPRNGKVRAEAAIDGPSLGPGQAAYSNNITGYFLDDPYEGELLVLFMSLFGEWANEDDLQRVWDNKKMQSATYENAGKKITVRKGHWYSSHEMWNFLVLPYNDIRLVRQVFLNGEKARTHYAADNLIPGLFASVHRPAAGYAAPGYASALGVPPLAKERVEFDQFVTPYAAFPVIIADRAAGLEWYRVMTEAPRMRGPYGTTESITVDGMDIAPVLTWDGKILPVAAFIAGAMLDEMREALKKEGVYDQFISLVSGAYKEVFGATWRLKGTRMSLALPAAGIPPDAEDFKPLPQSDSLDILAKANYAGGEALYDLHQADPETGRLRLLPGSGWIYTLTLHFGMEQKELKLVVKSTGGKILVELKNLKDEPMTEGKMLVDVPDTGGEFEEIIVRIPELTGEGLEERTLGIFGFADSSADVEFREIMIMPAAKDIQPDPEAVANIIGELHLQPGYRIRYEHEASSLALYESSGWIWSWMQAVDISEKPLLVIDFITDSPGILWLELKNKADEAVAYNHIKYNIPKIRLNFPDTSGKTSRLELDLSTILNAGVSPVAEIIAFSDPAVDVQIVNLEFKPGGGN